MKNRLVVDAGPIIAIFSQRDIQHQLCLVKFQQLVRDKYTLLTTFPVLCEIHKLTQQYAGMRNAQKALLTLLDTIEIVPCELADIDAIVTLLVTTSEWKGTLQDASVIILARQLKIQVWTLDYRDFSRFSDIELWN